MNVSIIASDEKGCEPWELKLARLPELHLEQWCKSGKSAIENIAGAHPDVVLLDCDLPDMTAIECLRHLGPLMHGYRVILVTPAPGPDDLVLVEAIKCGASGFLTKPVSLQDLRAAMQFAHDGGFFLNGAAAQRVAHLLTKTPRSLRRHDLLSRREEQIMNCIVMRASDKDIASILGISQGTVHRHLTNIFKKLGVNCRLDAAHEYFETAHLLASNLRKHRLRLRTPQDGPRCESKTVQGHVK